MFATYTRMMCHQSTVLNYPAMKEAKLKKILIRLISSAEAYGKILTLIRTTYSLSSKL
jgi:hypothetical protein